MIANLEEVKEGRGFIIFLPFKRSIYDTLTANYYGLISGISCLLDQVAEGES
ncbi:hypothetical protein DFP77_11735 [Marinomonas foliarum]|uniref:Uncharacterized protein n=1 Tax=Marinomonas foliarum TaxID=491950 RepID=A0A368ZWC9_9GAMM|nr:hypothetical protein DFP77_11735 [Marinomonas foliarum]